MTPKLQLTAELISTWKLVLETYCDMKNKLIRIILLAKVKTLKKNIYGNYTLQLVELQKCSIN